MARRSSGSGIGWGVLLVVGILVSIPREVWIWVLAVGVVGLILYLYSSFKSARAPQVSVVRSFDSPIRQEIDASVTSTSCWISQGKEITIAGISIPGGMIYVGRGLGSVTSNEIEPALVNPALPVRTPNGIVEQQQYWPSYSTVSADVRGAYLQWLSGGRKDPHVQIGFVFLFFYGLERRVLHDLRNDEQVVNAELPRILAEVRRLLSIYGSNSSFYGYANSFADLLVTIGARERLYKLQAPVAGRYGVLTMRHKVALGQAAVDSAPLPAEWAFSWLVNDERATLRTPAKRCPEEFRKLFLLRYAEKFGDGMKLPVNKTKLKLLYRPASSSFNYGHIQIADVDFPDVTVLEGPLNKLRDIAEHAAEQLDSYSRFLGRNPEKKSSGDAMAFLPPQLWPEESVRILREWVSKLGANWAPKSNTFGELCNLFPGLSAMKKDQAAVFAAGLEDMGVGIEPDVRWGGRTPNSDMRVVLFPLAPNQQGGRPSVAYRVAALTLHLAAAVSAADGEISTVEREQLEELLNRWLHLEPPERARLHAHMIWLFEDTPSLSALKKRVSGLSEEQKRAIAALLIDIAHTDGGVSPDEIKTLSKIYRLFGFDDRGLYGDVHAAATEKPITVRPAQAEGTGFGVPPKPAPKPGRAVALDHDRIAALHADTQRISSLLGNIFVDDEPVTEANKPDDVAPLPANSLAGLDSVLSELARVLLSRDSWQRAELEDLAADRGIMLDGVLEQINEAFLDKYDEPLLEGEGDMKINRHITRELHAA